MTKAMSLDWPAPLTRGQGLRTPPNLLTQQLRLAAPSSRLQNGQLKCYTLDSLWEGRGARGREPPSPPPGVLPLKKRRPPSSLLLSRPSETRARATRRRYRRSCRWLGGWGGGTHAVGKEGAGGQGGRGEGHAIQACPCCPAPCHIQVAGSGHVPPPALSTNTLQRCALKKVQGAG